MSAGSSLNPLIFRAYDIRGEVGSDLTPQSAELIGRAYATHLRREYGSGAIALTRDNRPSSLSLRDGFVRGVLAAGVSVTDIGVAPSPLMYFVAASQSFGGGVAVTASHSPTHMNGLKLLELDGIPLAPDAIQAVYGIAREGDFESGQGQVDECDASPEYLAMLEQRFALERPLRVVADPGNGVATLTGPDALRRIGCEVEVINGESDGTFPKHLPNPQDPATMVELCEAIPARGADFGVAWDGDGDRLGLVDERGQRREADELLAVFARDALRRHPGGQILVDVKTSLSAIRDIEAHGGMVVMGPTGHSLGKRAMREQGYPFGGEAAAHFYFAENFNLDDAVYAACALAHLVDRSGAATSELFAGIPSFITSPELGLPCDDALKFQVASGVAERFAATRQVLAIDGARIEFPDEGNGEGWALVRASNTGPALTLRFEATSERRFEEIRREVLADLERSTDLAVPSELGAR